MSPPVNWPLNLPGLVLLTQAAMSALQVLSVRTDLQVQCQTQIGCRLSTLLLESIIKSKSDVAKMKAADIKMLAEYLQQHLDHDPQNGEPLDFDKDCVMVGGAYPYSKSGNPTAADIKQGLRVFLAG